MSEVTRILNAIEQGDPHAAAQLLPLVYDELRELAARKMAQEAPGQTMQATALVHEAYLRLVDVPQTRNWNSRGHFFAAAAEAMRRILIEKARHKRTAKHGGGRQRVDLDAACLFTDPPSDDLLDLDEALTRLALRRPRPGRTGQVALLRRPDDARSGRGARAVPVHRRKILDVRPGLALRRVDG